MLINGVRKIPGTCGKLWKGIPTTCHFATLYWLYVFEFRKLLHSQDDYLNNFPNPTGVMTALIPYGKKLTRSAVDKHSLVPGTVLIFAHGHIAGHSCVAVDAHTIGGYNQAGWFSSEGGDHTYSTHHVNDIIWSGFVNPTQVRRPKIARDYTLLAVNEHIARAKIREMVQVL